MHTLILYSIHQTKTFVSIANQYNKNKNTFFFFVWEIGSPAPPNQVTVEPL